MLLEAELEKNTRFALVLAQALPRVKAAQVESVAIGGGNYRIRVVFANTGFLPTYGAKRALEVHATAESALVTLQLDEGVEIVSGPGPRVKLPHLEGRCRAEIGGSVLNPFMSNGIAGGGGCWVGNAHEARLEWVLCGMAGSSVTVCGDFGRGGRVEVAVALAAGDAKL